MNKSTNLIILCLCTLVVGLTGCPDKKAHKGAWIVNHRDFVAMYQFGQGGETLLTVETYSINPLVDGMKLEITSICVPEQKKAAQTTNAKKEDGVYTLLCSETKLVRSTQGIAMLFNLAQVLEGFGGPMEKTDDPNVFRMRLKVDGKQMIVYNKSEKRGETQTVFKRVESHKVSGFLKRFRKDTVQLKQLDAPSRRTRNLP